MSQQMKTGSGCRQTLPANHCRGGKLFVAVQKQHRSVIEGFPKKRECNLIEIHGTPESDANTGTTRFILIMQEMTILTNQSSTIFPSDHILSIGIMDHLTKIS